MRYGYRGYSPAVREQQLAVGILFRQLILNSHQYKEEVDKFVRELTFAERLYENSLRDKG